MAAKKKQSLEEAFIQLEEVLDAMEQEPVSLEESFQLYKKGMELVKSCHKSLDTVEKKMLVLNGEGETDEF